MMQKKILVFMLCGAVAVSLAGCGSSSGEDAEEKESSEETEEEVEEETEKEEEAEEEEETEEAEEEAEEEEVETLSPEEYLKMADTYCDSAAELASDIATAGKDLYMYYAVSSTTSDEVLSIAMSNYEEASGYTFESIGETLSGLTNMLQILNYVPEDETCEAWYQDVILPLNTDLINIYYLVYDESSSFLPGSLENSGAYLDAYNAITEDLAEVTAKYEDMADSSVR